MAQILSCAEICSVQGYWVAETVLWASLCQPQAKRDDMPSVDQGYMPTVLCLCPPPISDTSLNAGAKEDGRNRRQLSQFYTQYYQPKVFKNQEAGLKLT